MQVSHPCYFLFGVVIVICRSQRSSQWFAANDQKFFEGGRIMDESKNEPKTANDAPFWFNPQGEQMRVKRFDKDSRILDAVGDTTSVRIILLDASDEQRWILRWCVVRNNIRRRAGSFLPLGSCARLLVRVSILPKAIPPNSSKSRSTPRSAKKVFSSDEDRISTSPVRIPEAMTIPMPRSNSPKRSPRPFAS